MNKKLLVVATGAALAFGAVAANAAPTVYGSGRVVLESCDVCVSTSSAAVQNDSWEMRDATSRVGVKGDEDLGGGLKAVYKFEFGVDLDDGNEGGGLGNGRPHYVGLKGGFGQVTFGRDFNPYYDFIRGSLDIFNENWDIGVGNTMYTSRTSDMIKYASPNMGGFTLEAGLQTAGGTNGEDLDQIHLGAGFEMGPGFGKLGYVSEAKSATATSSSKTFFGGTPAEVTYAVAPAADFEVIGILGGAKFGPAVVTVGFEKAELGSVEVEATTIVGEVKLGDGKIMAGFTKMEDNVAPEMDTKFSHIEYQHNLSKTTRVWAALIDRDIDLGAFPLDDDPTIQLGMRVDF